MDDILNLIESVSEGFPSYFCCRSARIFSLKPTISVTSSDCCSLALKYGAPDLDVFIGETS